MLSPGETASASVSFGYASKHPRHAVYLEVTAPGGYNHTVVGIPDGIGSISNGQLYATAMARHTAYQGPTGCCYS